MRRTSPALLFLALLSTGTAAAQPAAFLSAKLPCPGVSPGGCTLSGVFSGQPSDLFVFAIAVDQSFAADYRGTVRFTSSDPSASLPPDFTFAAADEGRAAFTIALRTIGQQTIKITDTAGAVPAFVLPVTVLAAAAAPIPLSGAMLVLLGGLLALAGAWLSRDRVSGG